MRVPQEHLTWEATARLPLSREEDCGPLRGSERHDLDIGRAEIRSLESTGRSSRLARA